jgi:hypothetical protein
MHAVQLHVGALTRSANRGTCSMQTDSRVVLSHIHSAVAIILREPTPWPIRDACGPHARMSVIGGAGAAVCGLCGVAVPGSNVVEKYACTIGCCVLEMFVQGHH